MLVTIVAANLALVIALVGIAFVKGLGG